MDKKKIIFVYPYMNIGGSTSALLGLLNNLDPEQYDIDLQLGKNDGELLDYVPKYVHLLPEATLPISKAQKLLRMIVSGSLLKAVWHSVKYNRRIGIFKQDLAYAKNDVCRMPKHRYDIAVGGLEGWSNAYVNECVDADVKISWIHTDYRRTKLEPAADVWSLKKSDFVVCVSAILAQQLAEIMPEIAGKIIYLENVIPRNTIRSMAEKPIGDRQLFDTNDFKILTVARVSYYQKRLDRIVPILKRLLEAGLNVSWYIVGDGPDTEKIREEAAKEGVNDRLYLLGSRINPYPYYKMCDLYVLTSDIEGKPITVSEAMTLGLPTVVTEYESARTQISDGENGLVVANSEEALAEALMRVISDQQLYQRLKHHAETTISDNTTVVMKNFAQLCAKRYPHKGGEG